MNEAFFTLHADLPREGPGSAADVAWALEVAGVGPEARICDAGAGPGGDVAALLEAGPGVHVTAVDIHADFIEAISGRFDDPRVDARQSDMLEISGPFDFIWSAGAVYFAGVREALTAWRAALAPGGRVAFSHPAWFVDEPSEGARAFWQEYDGVLTLDALEREVKSAGYRLLDTRKISDSGWEGYFAPIEARIARLKPGADAGLAEVIAGQEEEIRLWRAHKGETGYRLAVVAPE